MNFKIILGILVLLALSSLGDATISLNVGLKYNGTDLIANYDEVFNWTINVSSTNNYTDISGGIIGNTSMIAIRNESNASHGTCMFTVDASLNDILGASYGVKCTRTITAAITDSNGTWNYTNKSITGVPCILTSNATAATMSITDKNTSVLTLTNLQNSVTTVQMALGGLFNTTAYQCNYGCTNANECEITTMVVNTTGGSMATCNLTITRIATDTGTVSIDLDDSIDPSPPSNIPKTVVGMGVFTILAASVVLRIRSRGGIR